MIRLLGEIKPQKESANECFSAKFVELEPHRGSLLFRRTDSRRNVETQFNLPFPYIILRLTYSCNPRYKVAAYSTINALWFSHKPIEKLDDTLYDVPLPHCSAHGTHCSHGVRGPEFDVFKTITTFYDEIYHYFLMPNKAITLLYKELGSGLYPTHYITDLSPYEKWENLNDDELDKYECFKSSSQSILASYIDKKTWNNYLDERREVT